MNEQEIQISFIIPAHNAGKYLQRSVKSVGEYADSETVEILIVENGSEDDTAHVAECLEEQYAQVHCLQSAKGVSNARNAGVESARGKWLFFLDADDYLPERAVEILLQDALDDSVDLYVYSYEKGDAKVTVTDGEEREIYDVSAIENCRVQMLKNPTRCMAVWGKLFKREVISQQKIMFDPMLRLAEDSDFLIRYSKCCRKIVFSQQTAYHYSTEAVSVVRTYDGTKTKEYVKSLMTTQQYIKADSAQIQAAYQIYVLMHLSIAMVREIFCMDHSSAFSEKLREMKKVLEIGIFREALEAVPKTECRSARMLPILLLKCHMYRLCGLVYQMRARQNAKREKICIKC